MARPESPMPDHLPRLTAAEWVDAAARACEHDALVRLIALAQNPGTDPLEVILGKESLGLL